MEMKVEFMIELQKYFTFDGPFKGEGSRKVLKIVSTDDYIVGSNPTFLQMHPSNKSD